MNQVPKEYLNIFNGIQLYNRQQRAVFFEELASVSPKGKTIFVGDSITEGFPVTELLSDYRILNRGIGGDTTEDVLKRLQSVTALEPRQIFLLIGTNNLGQGMSVSRTAEQISEICLKISELTPETQIYLLSVLPVNETKKASPNHAGLRKNSDIDKLNAIIAQLNGITYLDIASEFKDTDGRLIEKLTSDGLHLNLDGYLKYAEILKKYIIET